MNTRPAPLLIGEPYSSRLPRYIRSTLPSSARTTVPLALTTTSIVSSPLVRRIASGVPVTSPLVPAAVGAVHTSLPLAAS